MEYLKNTLFDLFDNFENYETIINELRTLNNLNELNDDEYDTILKNYNNWLKEWEQNNLNDEDDFIIEIEFSKDDKTLFIKEENSSGCEFVDIKNKKEILKAIESYFDCGHYDE